jgi:hypothetical protein
MSLRGARAFYLVAILSQKTSENQALRKFILPPDTPEEGD